VSNPTAIPVEDPAVVTVENSIPRAVSVNPDTPLRDYWAARAHQHTQDRYLGVKHLMWVAAPDTIVELGAQSGASTLWLRDRLRTLHAYGALAAPPRVIAVDVDLDAARHNVALRDPRWADSIAFVEGDVCDPAVRAEVGTHLRPGAVCMVIEDSAHVYATTKAALELYSDDWLATPQGSAFRVRRDLEVYGVSCHPQGFLQRVG
jgi:cephalosporin hydroxylase